MVTMYSDRSLTSTGQALLKIVQAQPVTAEQVATQVSYPIYRVRTSLAELTEAKLMRVQDGRYQLTDAGLQKIAES